MSKAHDADKALQKSRWTKAAELPPDVFAVWRKPHGALGPVAIVVKEGGGIDHLPDNLSDLARY